MKTAITYSVFQVPLTSFLQRSILGPILFTFFINGLFYLVNMSELTISSAEFSVEKLLETLERGSQIATAWFKEYSLTINSEKFQILIVKRNLNISNQFKFVIFNP